MEGPASKKSILSSWEAVGFVWEVFAAIAVPTVLCALGGRWLDRRFETTPVFMGLGLVVAVLVSGVLVYVMAKKFSVKMKA